MYIYTRMYVYRYALCMYVFMYACIYVLCMYACMYVYMYVTIYSTFGSAFFLCVFPTVHVATVLLLAGQLSKWNCAILQNNRGRPRDCYILIKGASDPQHVPHILYSFQPFKLSIRIDNTIHYCPYSHESFRTHSQQYTFNIISQQFAVHLL